MPGFFRLFGSLVFRGEDTINGHLLSFADNNTISINSKSVKLVVKDEAEESFTLSVKVKNKTIFIKKHLKGISQVLSQDNYLMFSIFTYADEDGNNEGYGYIIDITNNSVRMFSKKLVNTCIPKIIGNDVYFISGLNLLRTDLDLHVKNNYKGIYI